MRRTGVKLILAQLGLAFAASAAAADYWAYRYKEFDVVAEGSAAYAQSIARNLNTLDEALLRLLRRESSIAQPPTRVYALRPADFGPLNADWALAGGVFFRNGPFEHVLVVPSENEGPVANRKFHAARARAWLDSEGLSRLPDWFKVGFGQIVGAAGFDNDQLTLGQEQPAKQEILNQASWISVEHLFFLPASDPRFHKSPEIEALYEAQCWWLVHAVLFEGLLDRMMSGYLSGLVAGNDPLAMFSVSFRTNFDSMDKFLKRLRRTLTLRQVQSPMPGIGTMLDPVRITEPELKGRLAQLAVLSDPQSKVGGEWAAEVLLKSPDDTRGQLAMLESDLATRRLDSLLQGVRRLQQQEGLDAAGRTSLATTQITLARMRDGGTQGLDAIDVDALRANARAHLKRSLELDDTNPTTVYALGWLLASQGDVAAVRQMLPAAEKVYYSRPSSPELATLLVRLHALAGNRQSEFKFALVSQRLAQTDAERLVAQRRIDRLRETMPEKVQSPAVPEPAPFLQ